MLLSRHPLYTFAEAVPRPEGQYSVLSYIIPKIDVCWAEELVYFGYNTKSDTHPMPKFPNRTPARYPYADEYSLVLVGECLSYYVFPGSQLPYKLARYHIELVCVPFYAQATCLRQAISMITPALEIREPISKHGNPIPSKKKLMLF